MNIPVIDLVVFISYCLIVLSIALWISRNKKGQEKNSKDYFLAGNTLPWWAIGSSLIASNISAEQFIGMSGSGYALGLAIATYEWMAAATLIIVGKYFLPIFLEKKIYTMPQFLEIRFDSRVRTSLAVFWLLVYIFVNLTSVLYLGALSMEKVMGVDIWNAIIGLAIFAALYSLYGGLMAVAWTDVIQVTVLIIGGIITTYLALDAVSGGQGFFAGLQTIYEKAPERFDMILSSDHPDYDKLPGISVLIGGMWIINLYYWGFNQYIIQRALAARSLAEAQKGVIFAGYLKILMPLIVVIPGIAAFVLNADIGKSDEAYPWLLDRIVPPGITGLAFAALMAAIVSSLSSMMNSTSTIFTMDIYKPYFNKTASEKSLVRVGRIVSASALLIAIFVAKPLLGGFDQVFQFIQEFTGFVSPGIFVIFLAGLFWKKATSNSALWAAILTVPLSWGFKVIFPALPFIDRMGIIFVTLSAIVIAITLYENKGDDPNAVHLRKGIFHTNTAFNIGAIGICVILAVLYTLFW